MKFGKTVVFLLFALFLSAAPVHAAITNWQKAASLPSRYAEDYASDSFKQSVRNLKAANANTVSLIPTYYTSNCQSSNVEAGWNTPTTTTLKGAVDFAHSLGMRVNITPHLEAYDTWGGVCTWRANITPSDRNSFFLNYTNVLKGVASTGPDELTVGAELISLSSARINADNTARWNTVINTIKAAYPAIALTYSANWGSGDFATETNQIQFWNNPNLSTIGVSGYYELPSNSIAVADIQAQWDHWNNSNIKPLNTQYGKPVEFTEIGYKSVQGARYQPWNYSSCCYGDPNDPNNGGNEQANLYKAMFNYWNGQSFLSGVNLWDWDTDPNSGYPGNNDYTPQHKPAEDVIRQYFAGGTVPNPTPTPPPTQAQFAVSSTVAPVSPTVNSAVTITGIVKNNASGTVNNSIVDLEVRDNADNKIAQKFFDNQSFTAGQSQTYTMNWTPNSTGNYKVAMGVFNSDWTTNYIWNGSSSSFTVGTATTPTPTPTPNPSPTTCNDTTVGSFKGCYFDNADLTNFKVARNDASINFDWGNGSPDPLIGADSFSAQWQGTFNFNAATYDFTATADDGIRMSIDGVSILDKWIDEPPTTYKFSMPLGGGNHLVEVRYYENTGGATAKVSWTQHVTPTPTPTPTPSPTPPPTSGTVNIWWPSNGATVSGVQPFKAVVDGLDISQYSMYWQVDSGTLNLMGNSSADFPHKESLVDVSGWVWRSDNNYTINFVAKNSTGTIIAQKSIVIHVTQ
jgi:hypothetical protein